MPGPVVEAVYSCLVWGSHIRDYLPANYPARGVAEDLVYHLRPSPYGPYATVPSTPLF